MDKLVWVSSTCLANFITKEEFEKVNLMVQAESVGPIKIYTPEMSVKEKHQGQENTFVRVRLLSTMANGIKGIQVLAVWYIMA